MFWLCCNGFQFEDDESAESQVVEGEVDEVVAVADGELVLAADEGEAGSEFGQEVGQPGDEGFFEVPLVVVGSRARKSRS